MTSAKKRPYFNIVDVLKKYNIDYENESCIFCVNTIRNVGKTTSCLNWLADRVNPNKKVAFIRNNEEQLKAFKQDFNSRFAGRYMISGIMVWAVEKVLELDKEGNENVKYIKSNHVGYCGSISTYTKIKSIEAANIRYILFDEYNEDSLSIRHIYVKWINMIKTLSRFSKVFVIMLGNRDTPNNEFMVKWGVMPQKEDFTDDYFVQFSPRGYFLEMGSQQFDGLENDKTLANELAQFDDDSKRYLEGGYAKAVTLQVVPWEKMIKRTFKPLWKAAVDGEMCVFGEFFHPDLRIKAWALCHTTEAVEMIPNLRAISLDSLSYQIGETTLNTQESIYKYIESLFRLHKKKLLYYDSFDVLTAMVSKMLVIKY